MPQVVIVGFPNAGKSTLFNRLIRKRKALVHSLPGMTRDRVSAPRVLDGKPFELVDTGGFVDSASEPLSVQVKKAAWKSAQAGDIILLTLDGRRGLIPAEEDLFRDLNKLGKPLFAVVNKIDSEALEPLSGDYYRLGAEKLFFVSAEHNLGISALEEAIADALPAAAPGESAEPDGSKPLKIAVIGRTNVGKSSLANRLCGEERFIVHELPGTTRDSSDILIRMGHRAYVLVDTAGIRKLGRVSDERESAGVIKAKKNIPLADVLCLVLSTEEFPTRQDAAVAQLAYESGKPLVVALNKWDLVREDELTLERVKEIVYGRLDFINYAPFLTVSALTGKRVMRIFDLVDEVYRDAQKKVATSKLNKFMETMSAARQPFSKSGKRFRIKYMTQTGTLPPTFVLFASSGASLAPAYEKNLVQKLREAFGFRGSPIRLVIRPPKPRPRSRPKTRPKTRRK